jgi:hypothetical protein
LTKNYYNYDYGFSIEQPYGWLVEKRIFEPPVMFFGPRLENFTINIIIQVYNNQGMTLDEFVSIVKQNNSQSLSNYQLVSEQSKKISGLDSYEMVVTHTIENLNLKLKEVLIHENDKVFIISYTALQDYYDEYLSTFDTITETFDIL